MRRLPLWALAGLLVVLAGCQKLNYEKEATLDRATPYLEYIFEGPQGEMKVNVKATADQPVTVSVVLDEDKESALATVVNGKKPAKALAGEEDKKEIDFEATIPSKKSFVVFVAPGKGTRSATVKLNVKGK